ncbi:MAG: alkaline phosphatase family protein [bacterium]|nr:alkaline phosphatase family protein [bacterium]
MPKITMQLPNYKNGSIVNLMSSLARSFQGETPYAPLKGLDQEIFENKNVVLFIIDGLGYEFLKKHGRGGFLYKHVKQKITSVFPSTTAAGVTAFLTGVPAQQHGLTGWFLYLKELGLVSRILPFTTRAGRIPLDEKIKFSDVFQEKTFFEKIKADCRAMQKKDYADSAYSSSLTRGAKKLSYHSSNSLFNNLTQALKDKRGRKFIYAYWDGFDAVCHDHGLESEKTLKHFKKLDGKLAALAGQLENTVLVVTADHGMIDTPADKIINLENHAELSAMLSAPLCGEPRLAYCYIKAGLARQFEKYIKKNLKKYCVPRKSQVLIKKNYFGLFAPCPKLYDRVGDYALIMKENYIIRDFVKAEKREVPVSNHGGLSREEMFVPLAIYY